MEDKNEIQEKANACLAELNEVLVKYQMRLNPTFQIVPVAPAPVEEEVDEEPEAEDEVVTSEEEEPGSDEETE